MHAIDGKAILFAKGLLNLASPTADTMFALALLQTNILTKVNAVLALDKDDPTKEDTVKAVSMGCSDLKQASSFVV